MNTTERETAAAKTIIGQMGVVKLLIGARKFVALDANDERRGGVTFDVGRNAWNVEIVWNFLDLYDVRFRTRKSGRIGYEAENVYADLLPEVLLDGAGKCGPSGV